MQRRGKRALLAFFQKCPMISFMDDIHLQLLDQLQAVRRASPVEEPPAERAILDRLAMLPWDADFVRSARLVDCRWGAPAVSRRAA